MVSTMQKTQEACGAPYLESYGLIGKGLHIHTQVWDFGKVACNKQVRNAGSLKHRLCCCRLMATGSPSWAT